MLTKPASKTKRPTRRSGEAIQRPEGPTATRAEPTNLVPVDRVMMLSGWPDFLWSRAMFASCGPFETNASSAPGKTAMSAGFPCAGTLSGGDLPEGSIRQIEPSSWFATQTPLPSTATADGPLPTPMVLSTRFVVGSIRMSRPEVVGPPAAAAGEEEGGESGADQRDPDDGDGERPAAALRLGDPERLAGIVDQLAAGRVAPVGLLGERLRQHLLEPRQDGRRLLQLGVERRRVGAAPERRLAREALVEHAAERVHIGAAVDLLAADLLGGDVIGGAERLGRAERERRVVEVAAETEVGQVDVPALVEQHVRRLDVAVDEAARVGGVQGARDLLEHADGPRRLERPVAQHVFFRSLPSTRRIAMYSCPSISPASWIGTTFGCSSDAATRDSVRNRSRNETSSARCGASSFSATSRSSARSWAR